MLFVPVHDGDDSDFVDDLRAHQLAFLEQQREQVDPGSGLRGVVTRTQKRCVILRSVFLQKSGTKLYILVLIHQLKLQKIKKSNFKAL